ncbi:ornithine carbamoyltransferase [Alteribacter aurantiacus]|uniref:ornithine carbamoyltransferase n=1 Tax=Alteribacter aurantiacus TaxID=254410 RepID=UPI00041C906A|nr:ornithine carbamoyltransferase [Alteribacter aurantiacus]
MQSIEKVKDIRPSFIGRDFLTLADFTEEEIGYLIDEAISLKHKQKQGIEHKFLKGKTLGMIFEKSSTRTRLSFEIGMKQLGGDAIFLSSRDIQLGRGESIADTAKVLSRYVDGIMIRTFAHEKVEELAQHATVPIINGLTDDHHPAQVLADLMTIVENKGKLKGLKLCFVGDGNNNMTHSLIEGAALTGMNISVASPSGYQPKSTIVSNAKRIAVKTGSTIEVTEDPVTAIEGADVVVTDVWASMGDEGQMEERCTVFSPYQVNDELCKHANKNFIFLHCLPAHRGEEVDTTVIDGVHSVVFDEAENRLHAQKALLWLTMSN